MGQPSRGEYEFDFVDLEGFVANGRVFEKSMAHIHTSWRHARVTSRGAPKKIRAAGPSTQGGPLKNKPLQSTCPN